MAINKRYIKSTVHIDFKLKRVYSRFGYEALGINYYPISDDEWLETSLIGRIEDIDKIMFNIRESKLQLEKIGARVINTQGKFVRV